MLEAKYYRDYGHNYMILQCMHRETADSYRYRVLASGRIREILPCSVRYVNGSAYYYYDISSRASLDSMFRGRKMSGAQVKDILRQINGIYEKLAEYFMEESGLVLFPEHIYYDMASRKYIGLYYPDYRDEEGGGGRAFADFLLEHIDAEDRDLAEKVYRICEMAENGGFYVEDALRILEEGEEPVQEIVRFPEYRAEAEEDCGMKTEEYDALQPPSASERKSRGAAKGKWFSLLFAVLSVCGIAGAIAVYNIYELTQGEELMIYGAVAVMGLCLFVCIAGLVASGKKGRSAAAGQGDGNRQEYYPDLAKELYEGQGDFRQTVEPADAVMPSLSGVISRDMDLEMANRSETEMRAQPAKNLDGCANTVFFDGSAEREFKLYALDRKNKNHIELKRFPYTIGKMAGCVDHVIADASVSRIHARFDMQGERVLLTDMNSTNGTYKNGLRMQPQETVEIEPGDEIRFGSMNYCYR